MYVCIDEVCKNWWSMKCEEGFLFGSCDKVWLFLLIVGGLRYIIYM